MGEIPHRRYVGAVVTALLCAVSSVGNAQPHRHMQAVPPTTDPQVVLAKVDNSTSCDLSGCAAARASGPFQCGVCVSGRATCSENSKARFCQPTKPSFPSEAAISAELKSEGVRLLVAAQCLFMVLPITGLAHSFIGGGAPARLTTPKAIIVTCAIVAFSLLVIMFYRAKEWVGVLVCLCNLGLRLIEAARVWLQHTHAKAALLLPAATTLPSHRDADNWQSSSASLLRGGSVQR